MHDEIVLLPLPEQVVRLFTKVALEDCFSVLEDMTYKLASYLDPDDDSVGKGVIHNKFSEVRAYLAIVDQLRLYDGDAFDGRVLSGPSTILTELLAVVARRVGDPNTTDDLHEADALARELERMRAGLDRYSPIDPNDEEPPEDYPYNATPIEMFEWFAAIGQGFGHPARNRILRRLFEEPRRRWLAAEVAREFGIAVPLATRHLDVMADRRLIDFTGTAPRQYRLSALLRQLIEQAHTAAER